jgi:hypothetical protein
MNKRSPAKREITVTTFSGVEEGPLMKLSLQSSPNSNLDRMLA